MATIWSIFVKRLNLLQTDVNAAVLNWTIILDNMAEIRHNAAIVPQKLTALSKDELVYSPTLYCAYAFNSRL